MSGRIPGEFIDELIARADIAEVIGQRLQLRKAGREYKALCPFHGEKTPSFTVVPDKGFYHCFGCGAHGTALGFLMEHDHLGFVEAVETLASMLGLEVPREAGEDPEAPLAPLYRTLEEADRLYRDRLRDTSAAIDYLKRRGIDGPTAARFHLGYAPDAWDTARNAFGGTPEREERLKACGLLIENENGRRYDRFRDRIMFPIRDTRGRVVGFGGRILGQGEPKYLNSPETPVFHKGRELYGLYEARQALRQIPRLVVVEGYMDVVALARHGIDYAVATLGTSTTAAHLARLFRITDEVVFAFDGDRAGRAAAWRALEQALPEVREGHQLRFLFLPEGEDPDSLVQSEGAAAFERRLGTALPLSEYLVAELAGQVDLESVDGRARLAELARPLVARIPQGVYRELLLDRLGDRVGLGADRLARLLGEGGEPRTPRPAPARERPRPGRPTLVRKAMTLLLHYPQVAHAAGDLDAIRGVDRPGVDLLVGLIEDIRAHPHINTGMLLEHWREHP
jgi:DNA primase